MTSFHLHKHQIKECVYTPNERGLDTGNYHWLRYSLHIEGTYFQEIPGRFCNIMLSWTKPKNLHWRPYAWEVCEELVTVGKRHTKRWDCSLRYLVDPLMCHILVWLARLVFWCCIKSKSVNITIMFFIFLFNLKKKNGFLISWQPQGQIADYLAKDAIT